MSSHHDVDIAIIGAGVSGVYAAWRLLTEDASRRVAVFEGSDRVGGRLLSVTPPHIPYMVAELGGMRILPTVQPRIARLLDVLNDGAANDDDRIETYPFPVDQLQNIAYLRGVHLRLQDFTDAPHEVPYHLTFQEFGKTVGDLVINAIEQLVPGITNKKRTEEERRTMAQAARFDGTPLYQQGFWQVLMRVLSGEAYQLAIAAGGYETTLSNWNAADAIPWFLSDFGVDPEYQGFQQGFQQVPLTLAERVAAAGGALHCNRCLTGFDRDGDAITLRFQDGGTVTAGAAILAMPRRSLDLLVPHSPILQDPDTTQLIASVTPRPLFKLFTTYLEPWWLPAGVKKGRTTTDLPIRQTYYWPRINGKPARKGRAMLMASYDDGLNIGFWDGFRPKRGQIWCGPLDPSSTTLDWFEPTRREADPASIAWDQYQAPAAMVAEVQRQLAEIHGLQYVPDPEEASFKDWGDDPFGGGWNSWNIGVKSWEVKEAILQPVSAVPVYVCGEAYSDAQGWVEGALQTADLMLEKHFGIEPL